MDTKHSMKTNFSGNVNARLQIKPFHHSQKSWLYRKSICIFPSVLKQLLTEALQHSPSITNFGALLITCNKASQPGTDLWEGTQLCGRTEDENPLFPPASPAAGAVEGLWLQGLRAAAIGHK